MPPRNQQGRNEARETPAPDVQSSPPQTNGGEMLPFIWQQLNDIQARLGALSQAVAHQTSEIDKLDTKVDETKEKIHGINIRIAVAGALVALGVTITGFVLKEVWDVIKPTIVQRLTAERQQDNGNTKPAAQSVNQKPEPAKP